MEVIPIGKAPVENDAVSIEPLWRQEEDRTISNLITRTFVGLWRLLNILEDMYKWTKQNLRSLPPQKETWVMSHEPLERPEVWVEQKDIRVQSGRDFISLLTKARPLRRWVFVLLDLGQKSCPNKEMRAWASVWALLEVKFTDNFFLLRGNHECVTWNEEQGRY